MLYCFRGAFSWRIETYHQAVPQRVAHEPEYGSVGNTLVGEEVNNDERRGAQHVLVTPGVHFPASGGLRGEGWGCSSSGLVGVVRQGGGVRFSFSACRQEKSGPPNR